MSLQLPPGIDFKDDSSLRRILNGLPMAIAISTPEIDGEIKFCNDTFLATFGYEAEEIPNVRAWTMRAYPDPDYRKRVFESWNAEVERVAREGGAVVPMEFRITCKDGTQRDMLFSAQAYDDMLLVSLFDITARKKADEELDTARAELAKTALEVTENIPAGTYTMVLPADGGMAHFSFMSARFLEICGLDRKEAEENPFNAFACVHPDDYDEWVRKNAECFEKKIPFSEECRVVVNGVTRWIHAESIPRQRSDGTIVWEGVLSDITTRKIAEQKLARSESELRRILDNIPVPVAINTLGNDSRITFINEPFVRTFGYTLDEIPTVGEWAKLAYPDEEYRMTAFKAWDAAIASAAQGDGTIKPMEFRMVCKNGTTRDMIINAAMMEDFMLVGFLDITDRKKIEQALHQARQREKKSEEQQRNQLERKLRSSLAASAVAHEINQPLSTILLQSRMAIEEASIEHPALDKIAAEAQLVVRTIEKMKVLLRNVQTKHRNVNLSTVVKSSILQVEQSLAQHQIFVSEQGTDKACRILGDEGQLQLAITNLLRNAIEAIAQSGAEKRQIDIRIEGKRTMIELIIADSGPGFTKGLPTETPLNSTKLEGSGIGLYVVRTAMRNHNAKIVFGRSSLGGAEVRLRFPKPAPASRKKSEG